jgi:hypothetical protein
MMDSVYSVDLYIALTKSNQPGSKSMMNQYDKKNTDKDDAVIIGSKS